ncbi:unnamed protein product [Lampetra planeri]
MVVVVAASAAAALGVAPGSELRVPQRSQRRRCARVLEGPELTEQRPSFVLTRGVSDEVHRLRPGCGVGVWVGWA